MITCEEIYSDLIQVRNNLGEATVYTREEARELALAIISELRMVAVTRVNALDRRTVRPA